MRLNKYLSEDSYLRLDEKIASLYNRDPACFEDLFQYLPGDISSIVEGLSNPLNPSGFYEAIKAYNERLGAGKRTLQNISLLDRAFVVMCGQQPKVLTGAIFTIYKILQTISLARHLSKDYGKRFIPLFWNASECHNTGEVTEVAFLTNEEGKLGRLRLEIPQDLERISCGSIPMNRVNWRAFLNKVEEMLWDSEFKGSIIALLQDSVSCSKTLSEWFSSIVLRLFSSSGLVVVDPSDETLKRFFSPIFLEELEDPLSITQLCNEAAQQIETMGFKRQVHKRGDCCSFLLIDDGVRSPVSYSGGVFRSSKKSYTKVELKRILEDDPARFTTNVFLRPITASRFFPVCVYVAGPSELHYLAQTKAAFRHRGCKMPVVILRPQITIVEPRIKSVLEKHNLSPSVFFGDIDPLINRIIREKVMEANHVFPEVKDGVFDLLDKLDEVVEKIDSVLLSTLARAKRGIGNEFDRLEAKMIRHKKRRENILINQMYKAKRNLFPDGTYQERVFNLFYFLDKYGFDFLKELGKIPYGTEHLYLSIELQK